SPLSASTSPSHDYPTRVQAARRYIKSMRRFVWSRFGLGYLGAPRNLLRLPGPDRRGGAARADRGATLPGGSDHDLVRPRLASRAGVGPIQVISLGELPPGPTIRETIIGGKTGFLLPPTPEAFASRIASLDDATLQSMRSACIDRARQFDVAVFLKKIETALGRGAAEAAREETGASRIRCLPDTPRIDYVHLPDAGRLRAAGHEPSYNSDRMVAEAPGLRIPRVIDARRGLLRLPTDGRRRGARRLDARKVPRRGPHHDRVRSSAAGARRLCRDPCDFSRPPLASATPEADPIILEVRACRPRRLRFPFSDWKLRPLRI